MTTTLAMMRKLPPNERAGPLSEELEELMRFELPDAIAAALVATWASPPAWRPVSYWRFESDQAERDQARCDTGEAPEGIARIVGMLLLRGWEACTLVLQPVAEGWRDLAEVGPEGSRAESFALAQLESQAWKEAPTHPSEPDPDRRVGSTDQDTGSDPVLEGRESF